MTKEFRASQISLELSSYDTVALVEEGEFIYGAEDLAGYLVVIGCGVIARSSNCMSPTIVLPSRVWSHIQKFRWNDRPYEVMAYRAKTVNEASHIIELLYERQRLVAQLSREQQLCCC